MSDDNKGSEKFNTVFLVSQIQNERSRNVKIGIAVAVLIALGLIYLLFIKEPAPQQFPEAHGGVAAPAVPGVVPAPATPLPAQPAIPAPAPH